MNPEVGIFSFLFAATFVVLYLIARQVRRGVAYANRSEAPKERAGIYCVVVAIMGFAVGSLYQPLHERGAACIEASQPVVQCVLFQAR
ncbi:Conserved hypothetical protein [Pseudomonas brassicacearum subsp. brassicacearum NFM421]|uniref:Uncharacterized protein n=1 Tax=Pseudomonas brassicacearum (strain NFM421) TaxID=994484 RepID=F2KJG9_PSEBN|nr:hypothetical protein [Pseudomonas brassicacearum]AEA70195.1 Conserved hypothetical protein [Pseudomonas brassicacearum subsp. brassicacearum NFM421]